MNLHRFIKMKELVDLTIQLIQIPTENPPGNEKAAAQFLRPLLAKMGLKTKTVFSPKGRWNLLAEKRWGSGGKRLIFNGHLDVVPAGNVSQWKYPPFQGKLANERIYGRGSSDMKSGIASFIHALSLIERSKIPLKQGAVVLHLDSDEESHGHQGDTWHAAFGAQYRVADPWLLSAGVAYDSSLVDDKDRTPELPVGEAWRFGLGARYDWSQQLAFGLVYELMWMGNLDMGLNRGPLAGRVEGSYDDAAIHFICFNVN